ncbi:MAG: hypothetical protein Q4G18_03260 [Myroides sp.]|nr:hypothetical protein [Myroides sp.]
MLPIDQNPENRKAITEKVKAVITSKWEAIEKIDNLKKELGDLVT